MMMMMMTIDNDYDDFSYSSAEIFALWKVPQGLWALSKPGYQWKWLQGDVQLGLLTSQTLRSLVMITGRAILYF